VPSTEESAKEVELTGMLLFADASGRTDAIKIVDPSGKRTRIIVPEGLGEDVVRPLWNRQVVVTAKPKKRKYSLTDIREADE
jgi:hypothetical protein